MRYSKRKIPTLHITISLSSKISLENPDEWLKQSFDLTRSILSFVNSRFELINVKTNNKKHVHCIRFYPLNKFGKPIKQEYRIEIKLIQKEKSDFTSYYIENIGFSRPLPLLRFVNDILGELKKDIVNSKHYFTSDWYENKADVTVTLDLTIHRDYLALVADEDNILEDTNISQEWGSLIFHFEEKLRAYPNLFLSAETPIYTNPRLLTHDSEGCRIYIRNKSADVISRYTVIEFKINYCIVHEFGETQFNYSDEERKLRKYFQDHNCGIALLRSKTIINGAVFDNEMSWWEREMQIDEIMKYIR